MSERYSVWRVTGGDLVRVGGIERTTRGTERFVYERQYVESRQTPLSLSLPLGPHVYDAASIRPYFEGLLPEGPTREALVAQLQVPEDDWLALLGSIGLDCIGDVVVTPDPDEPTPDRDAPARKPWDYGGYEPLTDAQLRSAAQDLTTLAQSSEHSRLSLAGTQGKIGLAHLPDQPIAHGWLLPKGGAASTHIVKTSNMTRIAELELVCMGAASKCGLRAAPVWALDFGKPVACVERFDREVSFENGTLKVQRLHQEDLAQAFGVSPQGKYAELEGGTYRAIARLLRRRSADPLADIAHLARLAAFDYLVGNCDNHLKNVSVTHDGTFLRLAPAYDIVCTTYFEQFSRNMGRRLGSTRAIDKIEPDDFRTLAGELGIGRRRMQRICAELSETIVDGLMWAGERGAGVVETLPYSAEDVVDDIEPRRSVLHRFSI